MSVPAGNADRLALVAQRVTNELERAFAQSQAAGLYLVATPIGNLADISLRALAVLGRADVIYAEDKRHSATLLNHFAIRAPLKSYHEHNADKERPNILAALQRGERVALISDAGTPLISDPGYKLVREVIAEGHAVISIPGASAPLAALTAAGLPTDTFLFAGFLPTRKEARRARLEELSRVPATLIFFEAPTRLADSLTELSANLGRRSAVVARELTKLNEEFVRGDVAELAADYSARSGRGEAVKGEIVILVGPPAAVEVTDAEIEVRLRESLTGMSLRDAARAISNDLNVAKARVYDLGLAIKRRQDDG
jgi:16S rRNA (cytidine1402-2'-O)-methyltransferase